MYRSGIQVEAALQYAGDHLAERGEEDSGVLQELERTLALLAFEDPAGSPFADLLSPAHRQQVRGILGWRSFTVSTPPSHSLNPNFLPICNVY